MVSRLTAAYAAASVTVNQFFITPPARRVARGAKSCRRGRTLERRLDRPRESAGADMEPRSRSDAYYASIVNRKCCGLEVPSIEALGRRSTCTPIAGPRWRADADAIGQTNFKLPTSTYVVNTQPNKLCKT